MFKTSDTPKSADSGPQEEGRSHRLPRLPSDDLILAILWTLVILGILLLAVFLAPTLMGRTGAPASAPAGPTASPAATRAPSSPLPAVQPTSPPMPRTRIQKRDTSDKVEVSKAANHRPSGEKATAATWGGLPSGTRWPGSAFTDKAREDPAV